MSLVAILFFRRGECSRNCSRKLARNARRTEARRLVTVVTGTP